MAKVRLAQPVDVPDILDIYTPYVLHTAFTFETGIPDTETFRQKLEKGREKYPWLVCQSGEKICGYAYASLHRERAAYQWTCESSIYLNVAHKGRGVGYYLYRTLLDILALQGFRNVLGVITLPNSSSVRLHEKCGFRQAALFENIGFKLGNWQNVGWWKLVLNAYSEKPPPPLPFDELNPSIYEPLLEKASAAISGLID